MRSESLVLVETGHPQVELEADQGEAEGDDRVLEQLGPGAQLEHGGGGRDEESLVASQAQHQGEHTSHTAMRRIIIWASGDIHC